MKRKSENRIERNVILPLAAVFFLLLAVLLWMLLRFPVVGSPLDVVDAPPVPTPTHTPSPTRIDLYAYYHFTETQQIPVYDHREDKLIVMDFERYILGVVGAEMPTAYAPEALKAQAVAARTYALHKILHGGCKSHPEAACCTNSKCCQAYISDARMHERWGEEADARFNLLAEAVMSTAGEVLVYDGEVISALFHACSGGMTENSENVYSNALPYLRGVESPYEQPMRTQTVEVSYAEAAEKINAAYPDARVTAETVRDAVELAAVYPSGRVKTVRLGKVKITGKKLRPVFDLESAMFTLDKTETGFVFHVKGYGHGVGMSQNGANGYAMHGWTYDRILKHYYTGVSIEPDLNHTVVSRTPGPEA